MTKSRSIEALPIDSTKLCCNFVNTVYTWKGDDNYDFLEDYNTFIDWCMKLAVFDNITLEKLRELSKKVPEEAARTIGRMRGIRKLLHDFIAATARNEPEKAAGFLEQINALITEALSQTALVRGAGTYVLSYRNKEDNLISPMWTVLKSLYDLLTLDDLARVKECPACGWVFYDETKNGKRRWCNPLNCGTKDKMDRYLKGLREKKGKLY
jgi:predicted RNA-binding Zn ribbon-like protein